MNLNRAMWQMQARGHGRAFSCPFLRPCATVRGRSLQSKQYKRGGNVQRKIASSRKIYDAIIIGSGASGGMAAKELTERGLEVLVLEAGPMLDPAKDFSMNK